MKPRLVVVCRVTPAVTARAREEFDAIVAEGEADMTLDEMIAAAERHQAEALVIQSVQKLNAEVIGRLPPCVKVIATSSVGFEHIDVAAARARGIMATNTPGVLTNATADMTMLLILGACRRAYEYEALMRAGWRRTLGQGDLLGLEVSGRTLGIFGMGRIGQAVARRARAFGMPIQYVSRTRLPEALEEGATYFASLEAMLPHCEILSLHAPVTPDTAGIINARTLALLPNGAVLVNAARGALVDEDALLNALTSGHLFAAGIDVFRKEPDFDERFGKLSNVFLMPHMGSATVTTRNAMGFRALDNAAAVTAGRKPIDPLWS